MGRRTGSADLPLHGGRVPAWLSGRMARLGRVVTEAIVLHYGSQEFLRRLSHPFWFQAFGAVMGMDWHSSGITTSVVGALKRGLAPVSHELGIHVCGGRGRHSRRTPHELRELADRVGLPGDELVDVSRLVAKVDSAAVQDGFSIYLHSFVVTDAGEWAVVQQGMDPDRGWARRYHWLSEGLESFVQAPHSAIEGPEVGDVLNLTDPRAASLRAGQLELVRSGPDLVVSTLRKLREPSRRVSTQLGLPHLQMPAHHDVRDTDLVMRRLHGALAAAAENGPRDFAELLLTPGIGARTVYSLALVAEVIHGVPTRFSDPARYSTALGGKDGHPFPVPLAVYDETLRVLREAVARARLGEDDRLTALQRLDAQARTLERWATGPTFAQHLAEERRSSHVYQGRTGQGWARPLPGSAGTPSAPITGERSVARTGAEAVRTPVLPGPTEAATRGSRAAPRQLELMNVHSSRS